MIEIVFQLSDSALVHEVTGFNSLELHIEVMLVSTQHITRLFCLIYHFPDVPRQCQIHYQVLKD